MWWSRRNCRASRASIGWNFEEVPGPDPGLRNDIPADVTLCTTSGLSPPTQGTTI
jgi:hypothetical protein